MLPIQAHWSLQVNLWLLTIVLLLMSRPVLAQIVPDQTLGPEGSRVTPNVQVRGRAANRIDGGARRGANLFHSFREFNVGNGQRVYFANPANVRNILTRVTGRYRSNIRGTLGVDGSANLFLLNPNGIVFGPNARLDVSGSFVGTTANAIGFGTQGFFSATNPTAPSLLTVQPSALSFSSQLATPGQILVQGDGQGLRQSFIPIDTQTGLRVPGDRTLALIGGDLRLDGATLKTAGGRIELGSVASGSVALVPVRDGYTFNYDDVSAFQNIQLAQQSAVDASGLGGGTIQVRGNRISLTGGSRIETSTLGSQPGGTLNITANDLVELSGWATDAYYPALMAQSYWEGTGGDITVRANTVRFSRFGGIFAQAYWTGAGGNIRLEGDNIALNGQSRISTMTFGAGQGGDITIQANRRVDVDGAGALARIEADIWGTAGAQGGNLTIATPRLNVRSAQISSSVLYGNGRAGNLTVYAPESVTLSGEIPQSAGGFPGGLFAQININAAGRGGNLRIETGHLRISNGSKAQTLSFGDGDSGNIFISANRVEVLGTNTQNFETGIFVGTGLDPRSTELPTGNGGNLTIEANQISVQGGGIIAGSTRGAGNAGTVLLRATDSIVLNGESMTSRNGGGSPGGVFAQVEPGATGNGGSLRIETGRLSISNGSKVQVGTFAQGDAGNLFIRASEIDVFDTRSPRYITGIFAGVLQDPTSTTIPRGNGGRLSIETNRLSIRNGTNVSASNSGIGTGGDLLIRAKGTVSVVGTATNPDGSERPSFLGAEVFPQGIDTPASPEQITGRGGNLTVEARELSIRDGGRVSVSTFAAGDAGNIFVHTDALDVFGESARGTPSVLSANVGKSATGRGGNLDIETAQFSVREGGQVSAFTAGTGSAGSIQVRRADSITLDQGSISTAINRGAVAEQPSNITLQTRSLSLSNGSEITASTSGQGDAGDITVRGADRVTVSNHSVISTAVNSDAIGQDRATLASQGGDIQLTIAEHLRLNQGSQITASTELGRGGNVRINADDSVELRHRSRISAEATGSGTAGTLEINTGDLHLDRADTTVTSRQGQAGNLSVSANTVQLNHSRLAAATRRNGNGANIQLRDLDVLLLRQGSQIDANAGNDADGGNIGIGSQFIVAVPSENSDITANAGIGNGGRVAITTEGVFGIAARPQLTVQNDITATSEQGVQGIVTINQPDVDPSRGLVELPDVPIDATNQITQTCPTNTEEADRLGSFIISGRGGLPPNPNDLLSEDNTLTEWVMPTSEATAVDTPIDAPVDAPVDTPLSASNQSIVEAQGWVKEANGGIRLVAANSSASGFTSHCVHH